MRNLTSFLKDKKIDITINTDRLIVDAEEDILLKTSLLIISAYICGSNFLEGKKVNREYLKVLLYLCMNPEDFEELSKLKGAGQKSFFEHPKNINDINRSWSYYKTTYDFLKVVGYFKDINDKSILLTTEGKSFFELNILKSSEYNLFSKQILTLKRFEKLNITMKELGIL